MILNEFILDQVDEVYHSDTPTLQVKTTPGVGDFMYPLNRALMLSHYTGHRFHVEFNWKHKEDYLHHYEDPETIIERFEYTLPFYRDYQRLTYSHKFVDKFSERLERKRLLPNLKLRHSENVDSMHKVVNNKAYWKFNNTPLKTEEGKVVIWRSLFNAEPARAWKQVVTHEMWEEVIYMLKAMDLDVVELTYRTPVREVHYHCATCDFVVCYDGMWHYFAKNYFKPMIVTSRSNITKLHTPQALMLHDAPEIKGKETGRYIIEQLPKMFTPADEYRGLSLYDFIHDKAKRYEMWFDGWYKEYANR